MLADKKIREIRAKLVAGDVDEKTIERLAVTIPVCEEDRAIANEAYKKVVKDCIEELRTELVCIDYASDYMSEKDWAMSEVLNKAINNRLVPLLNETKHEHN